MTRNRQTFRVLKFGGSSVGQKDRLFHVVERILGEHSRGPTAVVVSAMGDTTDWLLEAAALAAKGDLHAAERVVDRVSDLATENGLAVLSRFAPSRPVASQPSFTLLARELLEPLRKLLLGISLLREQTHQATDLVLSFGERLSATFVAEIVTALGAPGLFVDARSWMITDDTFGAAVVDWPATAHRLGEILPSLRERVSIHTGFLGQTPDGRTTTLGRNGSDYTATLLARGLGADDVVICTDVPGVMTGDPTLIEDAYPVPRLSYAEAMELATYGARMFHPRTMLPLIESGIPMIIRNTMSEGDLGTRIDAEGSTDERRPTCVTSLENLALIDVRSRQLAQPARMGRGVLGAVDAAGITVWMASQAAHGQAVSIVIPRADVPRAVSAIERSLALELERKLVGAPRVVEPVTLLSLVAERMRQDAPGMFFETLAAIGVEIHAIAQGTSSRSISCVIGADDTPLAVRAVHAASNFAHQRVSVCVLGKGTVGRELIEQIRAQHDTLEREHDVSVRLVALADRATILVDEAGLDLNLVPAALAESASSGRHRRLENSPEAWDSLLETLRRLPVPVLVDLTAAEGMEGLFMRALAKGVHVVSANKKPLTVPLERYRELLREARHRHRALHYETTVGASLPVIETLKNILRTGDVVHRIEGALSGTLGYLTNEAMAGVPLSRAVERAVLLGYAEPTPEDDLSGADVARKALILARELGLPLDFADIEVEPLVPQALLAPAPLPAFLERLRAYDAAFSERVQALREQGLVLRYLAIIDPGSAGGSSAARAASVRVGPVGIEASHPATRLRGAEAFVAFTTHRYREYPLIVQGAGAGGAVTASGVLSDILRIANTLRGRG
ncbi:MAG: aspartate kinase [Polyangiaceae bacterium]|nr:aspartate kinase [Polyangiaceae bacterium]